VNGIGENALQRVALVPWLVGEIWSAFCLAIRYMVSTLLFYIIDDLKVSL